MYHAACSMYPRSPVGLKPGPHGVAILRPRRWALALFFAIPRRKREAETEARRQRKPKQKRVVSAVNIAQTLKLGKGWI